MLMYTSGCAWQPDEMVQCENAPCLVVPLASVLQLHSSAKQEVLNAKQHVAARLLLQLIA